MNFIDSSGNGKLLTIAIPTFNRCKFLDILLESIYVQLIGEYYSVQVIIYDNNSTDSTSAVVLNWINKGLPISYHKNATNVGPDRNIAKAFCESLSKYVWIVGDDDILLSNAIRSVIYILNNESPSLIYLKCQGFSGHFDFRKKINYNVIYNSLGKKYFLRKTNIHLTFITAIIINREAFFESGLGGLENFYDTHLVQLGWVLPSVYLSMPLIYVSTPIVAGRNENRSGYGQFNIFVNNFNKILLICYKNSPAWIACIRNVAIRQYYPSLLIMNNDGSWGVFEKEKYKKIIVDNFKENYRYWIFLYPFFNLPVAGNKFYYLLVRVINFILRFPSSTVEKFSSKTIRCD